MTFTDLRIKTERLVAMIAIFQSLTGCGGGSTPAPDVALPPPPAYTYSVPSDTGDTWSVAHADGTGLAVSSIEAMMNAVRSGQFPIVDSIAIAHRGNLVFDETIRTELHAADSWVGNTDLKIHLQYSVSKSFASALAGVAIDQGVFSDIDTPYLTLFPYTDYENPDSRKDAVTLHDVLAMRLGIEWNEWDPPYSDPDNQLVALYDSEVDYSKALLDLPMAAEPGTTFAYNTAATVSIGQAIENNAPLSLIDYGLANLLGPLGISRVEVLRTPTGLPNIGGGLYMTGRDVLKLGQLYLDNGRWNGESLISSDWVSQSLVPYTEFGWRDPEGMAWELTGYGYQWWLGHFEIDGEQIESYAAWGYGEQWVMVIPALELVIAISGHGFSGSKDETNQPLTLIRRYIIPAAIAVG